MNNPIFACALVISLAAHQTAASNNDLAAVARNKKSSVSREAPLHFNPSKTGKRTRLLPETQSLAEASERNAPDFDGADAVEPMRPIRSQTPQASPDEEAPRRQARSDNASEPLVRYDDLDRKPVRLRLVAPKMPKEHVRACTNAKTIYSITVGSDGRVRDVIVKVSAAPDLDRLGAEALENSHWAPGRVGETSVATRLSYRFTWENSCTAEDVWKDFLEIFRFSNVCTSVDKSDRLGLLHENA